MKKFKLAILLVAVISLVATCVFAATTIDTGNPFTFGTNNVFRPSANVTIIAVADATSYAATAKHLNGDREFGGTSTDTILKFQDATAGTAAPSTPSASDSSAFSGWKSL